MKPSRRVAVALLHIRQSDVISYMENEVPCNILVYTRARIAITVSFFG